MATRAVAVTTLGRTVCFGMLARPLVTAALLTIVFCVRYCVSVCCRNRSGDRGWAGSGRASSLLLSRSMNHGEGETHDLYPSVLGGMAHGPRAFEVTFPLIGVGGVEIFESDSARRVHVKIYAGLCTTGTTICVCVGVIKTIFDGEDWARIVAFFGSFATVAFADYTRLHLAYLDQYMCCFYCLFYDFNLSTSSM